MKKVVKKIVENTIQPHEWYIEPFLGDCSTFSVIKHNKKVGCDINKDVTTFWKNVQKNSLDNECKDFEGIKDSLFINCDYKKLILTESSFIFCNVPINDKFNHKKFWDWCEKQVEDGHIVLVKNFDAPLNYVCVWDKRDNKLFVHISQLPYFNLNVLKTM